MEDKMHRPYRYRLVSLLMLMALVLGAFTFPVPTTAQGTYSEAPALAQLVKEGKLPPVAERLPKKPLVVNATQVGTYGGEWRMGMRGGTDDPSFYRIVTYENLVRWTPNRDDIIPNLAESWEINKDATEYTFHLREGMKWSDGVPFTSFIWAKERRIHVISSIQSLPALL
jgi:peptide/nickel transport system substrate-binding protein